MNIWPTKKLREVLEYEQPTKYLVSSTNYKDEYPTPVLTAGKSFILGNTNEKGGIFPREKLPVIIFDDFTTATKFVDFPFKVKSSAMKILHAKKDIADISYLFYKIQTINFKPAQHKRYWISEYSNLKIPILPLQIQKQIVERLDKIAEAQKLNDGLIQKTNELFQSLLHQELNPAGPANAKAMTSKKDWDIKILGELINVNFGERITRTNNSGNKYPVYGGGGESFRTDKFNRENEYVISRFAIAENCVRFVQGKFWLMDSGGTFSIKTESADKLDKKFIGNVLLMKQKEIYNCARGGAQKNIDVDFFKKIKISLPPIAIQKQIVAKLSAVQEYKTQLLAQKSKLKELFDSALSKSMSGN